MLVAGQRLRAAAAEAAAKLTGVTKVLLAERRPTRMPRRDRWRR